MIEIGALDGGYVSGNCHSSEATLAVSFSPPCSQTELSGHDPRMVILVPQPKRVGARGSQVTLPGSPIALQCLILCDFADALGLLGPHLDDVDLVAIGDSDRNLLASGLDLL